MANALDCYPYAEEMFGLGITKMQGYGARASQPTLDVIRKLSRGGRIVAGLAA
ncbi:MAG: hypothetical protein ABSG03_04470 [Bryobacteraceae bacterium]|jgi:hypothetical protein